MTKRSDIRSSRADLPVYLSLNEAAEVMSMSVKTIRRRIAEGTIPAYSCGHGSLRIRLDELENALRRVPAGGRASRSDDAPPRRTG